MSSLGDIQQIYTLLQEIDKLLANIDISLQKTDDKVTKTIVNIQILERTILSTTRLIRKMTGDENLDRASQIVAQVIMLINNLNLSLNLLMASNPLLFPLGILGFANTAVSAIDMAGSYA